MKLQQLLKYSITFILFVFTTNFFPYSKSIIFAAAVQDNSAGTWIDEFSDNSGLSSKNQVGVDASDNKLKLTNSGATFSPPYHTSGYAFSDTIMPLRIARYNSVVFNASVPEGTTLKIQVCDGSNNCFSEVDLPGNSEGFTTSPIDLTNIPYLHTGLLNYSKVGRIRLKVILTTTDTNVTPTLSSWSLIWDVTRGDTSASPLAENSWPTTDGNKRSTKQTPYYNSEVYPVVRWKKSYRDNLDGSIIIGNNNNIYAKTYGGYEDGTFIQGYFSSLNKDTGEVNWEKTTYGFGHSSPHLSVSENDTVYNHCEFNDVLIAINGISGEQKWAYNFGQTHSAAKVNIADDGTIYTTKYNNSSKTIYAFNPDGTMKWTNQSNDDPNAVENSSGVSIGPEGTIYFNYMTREGSTYTNNGQLIALNPSDGSRKWSYPTGGNSFNPAIDLDGTIYTTNGSNSLLEKKIYAINPDGSLKWEYSIGTTTEQFFRLSLRSDNILLAQKLYDYGEKSSDIYAIDTTDGSLEWQYNTQNYSGTQIISDGLNNFYYGDSNKNEDTGMYESANFYYFDSFANQKWRLYLNEEGNIFEFTSSEYAPDEKGRLYLLHHSREELLAGWQSKLVALFPWTLSVEKSPEKTYYKAGDEVTFSVTTAMQENDPLTEEDNKVQIVFDNDDKLSLNYSSTNNEGDTVWTGTYVIPESMNDGSHSFNVEANQTGVETDVTVHFDSPANNSSNTGRIITNSFTIDSTAPTSTSISINSDAEYTIDLQVSLTLSAEDELAGVSEMKISENSNFSGADWEDYSTSKDWTLSTGDGSKTVYIKFKDAAGNESDTYLDSITLDTNAPDSFDTNSSARHTNDTTPTLSWPEVDGTSYYQLFVNDTQLNGNLTNTSYTIAENSAWNEGDYSWYVIAFDTAGNQTQSTNTRTITVNTTSPDKTWTNEKDEEKTFELHNPDNVYTEDQYPTFTFTKAYDDAGIDKYQVLVNNQVYIDNIPHDKENGEYDEEQRWYHYEDDYIKVRSKKDKLDPGAYKYKVRAKDKAGNTTDTDEKILRIKTRKAIFSQNTWFPISLLHLGGRDINYTTEDESSVSNLSIYQTTPTFYGIAPAHTKIKLKLKKEGETIIDKETNANGESRFGINITDSLNAGTYTVYITATNTDNDYVELPEFELNVGGIEQSQTTLQPTYQPTEETTEEKSSPEPTSKPIPKQKTKEVINPSLQPSPPPSKSPNIIKRVFSDISRGLKGIFGF